MLSFAVGGSLALIGGLVLFRIVTHPAQLRGMLVDTTPALGAGSQPERVQLLVTFLFALGAYAYAGLRLSAHGGPIKSLPDAPTSLLVLLGASQTVYLSGKIGRSLKQ